MDAGWSGGTVRTARAAAEWLCVGAREIRDCRFRSLYFWARFRRNACRYSSCRLPFFSLVFLPLLLLLLLLLSRILHLLGSSFWLETSAGVGGGGLDETAVQFHLSLIRVQRVH